MAQSIIQNVKFDERGLIPAIIQDCSTTEIVALCYMDSQSLVQTLQTGKTSPASQPGGETDLDYPVVDVRVNLGGESSLTILVDRHGSSAAEERVPTALGELTRDLPSPAERSAKRPHTGLTSAAVDISSMKFGVGLQDLYVLISQRFEKRPEGSYTTYLFNSGLDKILKKIAEEAGEVIIASKNKSQREIVSELADLFYHVLVLMVEREVKLSDVHEELSRRASFSPVFGEIESQDLEGPAK